VRTHTQDARHEPGKILRTRRLEHNLTQRNLTQKAHLDYTYVSKIEGGSQAPSVVALVRIADVLGLSSLEVNELLALMGRLPENLPVSQRRVLAMYYPEQRR
jgi:transcriptional regulator with XRE-family HTH domain